MKNKSKSVRAFVLTLSVILITFSGSYGIVTAYVNINNTISSEKISATEVIRTGESSAEVYVLGEYAGELKKEDIDLPPWLWGAMPTGAKALYIGIKLAEDYLPDFF